MGDLSVLKQSFLKFGWFIPPYRFVGTLEMIARSIDMRGDQYDQDALERDLSGLYGSDGLAAMVLHRYPVTPIIQDYRVTISEAIEAHFIGLDHVAVGGLVPALEGVAVRLAAERNVTVKGARNILTALAEGCKLISVEKRIGDTAEIASMMDAFSAYAANYMYVDSAMYPLVDKTNRHGIAHGHYADVDYGRPLNFYKTITRMNDLHALLFRGLEVNRGVPRPRRGYHAELGHALDDATGHRRALSHLRIRVQGDRRRRRCARRLFSAREAPDTLLRSVKKSRAVGARKPDRAARASEPRNVRDGPELRV